MLFEMVSWYYDFFLRHLAELQAAQHIHRLADSSSVALHWCEWGP